MARLLRVRVNPTRLLRASPIADDWRAFPGGVLSAHVPIVHECRSRDAAAAHVADRA
jgi:hypothetical protein